MPTQEEAGFLKERQNTIENLIIEIDAAAEVGALPDTVAQWCEGWLNDPPLEHIDDVYLDPAPAVIAMGRYLLGKYLDIPIELTAIPELGEGITPMDRAILVGHYLKYCLKEDYPQWQTKIEQTMKRTGYRITEKGVRESQGIHQRVAQLSLAKIKTVPQILKKEYEMLNSELGALVITDFIYAHRSKGRLKELIAPESGGAVGVFRYLAKDPIFDDLKPAMVTGEMIMIHPDLIDGIDLEGDLWIKTDNYYTYNRSFKATLVLSDITTMMLAKKCHCLVGTRALMGEGYDNIALNTLIDLTAAASFVTTNQIRGRVLRLHPDYPDKTANIWEIISLFPNETGGGSDLKRVKRKHDHFLSMSHTGRIESGMAHLELNTDFNPEMIDQTNTQSIKRSHKRGDVYIRWGVGAGYQDCGGAGLQISGTPRTNYSVSKQGEKSVQEVVPEPAAFTLKLHQQANKRQSTANIFALIWIIIGVSAGQESLGIAIIAGFLLIITVIMGRKWVKKGLLQRGGYTPEDLLHHFADILCNAFEEMSNESGLKKKMLFESGENGFWVDLKDERYGEIFAQSLQELLTPRFWQKYALTYPVYDGKWVKGKMVEALKEMYHIPVPAYFSKNKQNAQIFQRSVAQYLTKGELIYLKGKERHRLKYPFRLQSELHQVWY